MEVVNQVLDQLHLKDVVKEDPETNAVWVLRFTSIQFVRSVLPSPPVVDNDSISYSSRSRIRLQALALFESLYRPDTNAALAVVGLYGAFSKNKDVVKLYFAFMTLSCLTDLIWMISWGPMLGRDFPERESIERFALAISIMEFILKVDVVPKPRLRSESGSSATDVFITIGAFHALCSEALFKPSRGFLWRRANLYGPTYTSLHANTATRHSLHGQHVPRRFMVRFSACSVCRRIWPIRGARGRCLWLGRIPIK